MANKFFKTGSGLYTCKCCGNKTRDINGDAANCNLCAECFDVAGCENAVSDGYDGAQNDLKKAVEACLAIRNCEKCKRTAG